MSLLTIVQNATDGLTGVTRPVNVIASTDENVRLLLRLANLEGQDLAQRHAWQQLNREASHTTLAAQDQGDITTVAGPDFDWIVPDTMWNTTLQQAVPGPLSPQERRMLLARTEAGAHFAWWLSGGRVNFYPKPAAGQTVTFEWQSRNWCENVGGIGQSVWTSDNDVARLDEELITLGVIWRFLKSKGLDYSEEFRSYEMRLANRIGRDGGRRALNMGGGRAAFGAPFVPEGSWGV
jgi:hypothetical protein